MEIKMTMLDSPSEQITLIVVSVSHLQSLPSSCLGRLGCGGGHLCAGVLAHSTYHTRGGIQDCAANSQWRSSSILTSRATNKAHTPFTLNQDISCTKSNTDR
jgi:hypothetical protein